MRKKKYRIGIFASSRSLIERIQTLSSRQDDHIYINTQGLDEAVPIGLEMEKNGIEVIISRRGTAHLLRENLHIPVLSFPHRSLDIIMCLKTASEMGRRILLPVFRQKMGGIGILEELLNIQLIQDIYQDKKSLERVMTRARRNGCQVVVGGSVTQQIAEATDLRFVEIRTSNEDIADTIENAKSVAQSGREREATARQYRSIIDAASDGIIAVDDKGIIATINATACEALNISDKDAVGRHIANFVRNCPISTVLATKQPVQDRLGEIKKHRFIFNHQPVLLNGEAIGAITTFRDIGNVMRSENVVRRSLSKGHVAKYDLEDLVHVNPAMRDLVNIGKQYAKTDSTVLLMGETGTGKEILAHGIHNVGGRSDRPFLSVNCAALPEQLLESELFGYEEGAFTGSKKGGKPGMFEIAHQGTIFLDEIDSTPMTVQIRLLRVLQEREMMRVGGDRKIPVDVRVIAAASQDLDLYVQKRKFRADLFFRLNVLRIQIPPLRNRQEDIPVLMDHFIQLFSERQKSAPIILPDDYMERLKHYEWPGNVRQLRNFSERVVMNCNLNCSHNVLEVLYRELVAYADTSGSNLPSSVPPPPLSVRVREESMQNEKAMILSALEKARYRKSKAAQILGISRTTLWRKIKEFSIE